MNHLLKSRRMLLTFATLVLACHATTSADDVLGPTLQKSMIWAPAQAAPPGKQVYVAFRKTFDLDARARTAKLAIFADNRYLLWINGRYVERGPCRFDPRQPEYDTLDVADYLRPGRNTIAVVVHYYAIGSFAQWSQQCARMMEHTPGLTARLEMELPGGKTMVLSTDETWRLSVKTRYQPSPSSYSSVPDNLDARRDDGDWTTPEYDDRQWPAAARIAGGQWGPLRPRSIPLLATTELRPLHIAALPGKPSLEKPLAIADHLPLELKTGERIVVDLGRTAQAYAVLDFDADEGSTLELLHASRYYETDRKPWVCTFTGDDFKDRYTARRARQTWMTGDTWGGRYLALTVGSGRITLHGLKAVDRRYPFTRLGRFQCSDEVLNKIWETCVNTVEACCEDAHVDCADRERAQWMADGFMMGWPVSRVALAGPGMGGAKHQYADSRLLRNMLRHMALSQLPDGRLQPMRPSDYPPHLTHGVIDDYSCLWVQALWDVYSRSRSGLSGQAPRDEAQDMVRALWPTAEKAMDYFLQRRSERGLVRAMEFVYFKNPLAYKVCEGTSVNCYVYRSLLDASLLARVAGHATAARRFDEAATSLRRAINEHLWDTAAGSFAGARVNGEKTAPTAHAALLALYYRVLPGERQASVYRFLLENIEKEGAFPYTYRYFLEVLSRQGTPEAQRLALQTIRRRWEHMTRYESGTTSEDWQGGSFVHESGAHPAYFLSTCVLGVRTLASEGAARLLIAPQLGDLKMAAGTVLSECGPTEVSWKKSDDGRSLVFALNLPTEAVVHIPRLGDKASLVVDGKKIEIGNMLDSQYFEVHLAPGRHGGEVRE